MFYNNEDVFTIKSFSSNVQPRVNVIIRSLMSRWISDNGDQTQNLSAGGYSPL